MSYNRLKPFMTGMAAMALAAALTASPLSVYATEQTAKTETQDKAGNAETEVSSSSDLSDIENASEDTSASSSSSSSSSSDGTVSMNRQKLTFNESSDKCTVTLDLLQGVQRYELLYKQGESAPGMSVTMGGNSYQATYGVKQPEGSPVTVRLGGTIDAATTQDGTTETLQDIAIYIDNTSGTADTASLVIARNKAPVIAFAMTKTPDDWQNIVDGEETHLAAQDNTYFSFIDSNASFIQEEDLAEIEAADQETEELPSADPPVQKKPDMTMTYIELGGMAAAFIILVIVLLVWKGKKSKAARKERKKNARARKRKKEVEEIKSQVDLNSVLNEDEYSDDDYVAPPVVRGHDDSFEDPEDDDFGDDFDDDFNDTESQQKTEKSESVQNPAPAPVKAASVPVQEETAAEPQQRRLSDRIMEQIEEKESVQAPKEEAPKKQPAKPVKKKFPKPIL